MLKDCREEWYDAEAKVAVTVLCLIALAFSLWTFVPPRIPLFQDPVTGTYGFQQG